MDFAAGHTLDRELTRGWAHDDAGGAGRVFADPGAAIRQTQPRTLQAMLARRAAIPASPKPSISRS